jgi:hypothetical protein
VRTLRLLLVLSFVAWAGLGPAWADEGTVPVQLVSPQPGATLRAGSTAELEWEALGDFARLREVEEWEAFLSLDGGATYPVRITPHLDRDLRRVRWQVPGIATSDARLLLRFGDEREETFLELPQRFAIASAPGMEQALALAGVASAPGEPALPGDAGVVAWVEGSRRGGSLRQVIAPERPALRSTFSPPETHPEAAVLVPGAPMPQPAPAPRSGGRVSLASRGSLLRGPAKNPPLASDVLLLTQRQNE